MKLAQVSQLASGIPCPRRTKGNIITEVHLKNKGLASALGMFGGSIRHVHKTSDVYPYISRIVEIQLKVNL